MTEYHPVPSSSKLIENEYYEEDFLFKNSLNDLNVNNRLLDGVGTNHKKSQKLDASTKNSANIKKSNITYVSTPPENNKKSIINNLNEFELIERSASNRINRNRTNSNSYDADSRNSTKKNRNSDLTSSFKRLISTGREKLSPSQIFANAILTQENDSNDKREIKLNFKNNRSISNTYSYKKSESDYGEDYDDENDCVDETMPFTKKSFEDNIDDYDDDHIGNVISNNRKKNAETKNEYLSKSLEESNMRDVNKCSINSKVDNDIHQGSSLSFSKTYSASDSTSSSSNISTPSTQNLVKKSLTDENNNKSMHINNLIDNNDGLNVIIIDDKHKAKRGDSIIRARHPSHINLNNSNNNDSNIIIKNSFTIDESKQANESISKAKSYRFWKKNNRNSQRRHNIIVVFLLFVVNLINYIDRYTLAGVLVETQKYFGINDGESGLLQTVFICSYMLLAPLFGYLGDRYSRKLIIIFGISFWSFMTLVGSFIPADKFWLFVLIRSLVGIGEASYSCVAPTIIGDLFTNEMRTKVLALFYLAVPVGSGLGYIVGSNVASAFNNWKWALRITPPLGFLCVIILIFIVKEPKRGGAEGSLVEENHSSIKDDVIYLLKNKTFMWITFGFTFASFVLGGLSWWVPTYVQYAIYSNNKIPDQIPLIFGIVTVFSGLIGVGLSSVIATKLRTIYSYADALVCALGSLLAVPSLFILLLITRTAHPVIFWSITAFAISSMCLSWTIVADILLYTIYPNKRSIASALNILICHLLGDAGSPYVIGVISDYLRAGKEDTYYNKFTSLQTALYAGPFFAALSFAAYLFAAIYIDEDKKKVDIAIRKNQKIHDSNVTTNQNSSNDLTSNENSKNEDDFKNKNTIMAFTNPLNDNSIVNNINENVTKLNENNQNKQIEQFENESLNVFNTNSSANLLNHSKQPEK